ncbi:MAG: STAS domain-containing protein [Actinobacteria bacterium]|nr:MAG: STAS domain-containing protein [Actinomycetota bacterium]TML84857.1 MAG: STAS domain-containing protein [Actinomycetota bacterium]
MKPFSGGGLTDDRGNIEGDGLRKHPVLGVEQVGDAYVVRLGGELDLYNAAQVRAALVEACAQAPERIVVDLGEVEFLDSTALGVLIEARTKLDNRGGLVLAAPRLETRRALQISGLDKLFAVHDTVPEALGAKV